MNLQLNQVISFISYKNCSNLFNDFSNFPYACIKGEALSIQAYGKVGCRTFTDIDILIPREYITEFKNILQTNGFFYDSELKSREGEIIALSATHQTPPFIKNIGTSQIIIDLNFDVFWGEYDGIRINISEFLNDSIELDVHGLKIKSLPPSKALIQLVLHHYNHMNSIYHIVDNTAFNINMFKDIYYLWKNNKNNELLDDLYKQAVKYKIMPFMFYVFYYTNEIFLDSDFAKYCERFKDEDGIELLNKYGLSAKEKKFWKIDFKSRLNSENLYKLIQDELSINDIEKINRSRRIFGKKLL